MQCLTRVSHSLYSYTDFFFFFLLIRPPPRSTLFPYTTPLPIYSSHSCFSVTRRLLQAQTATSGSIASSPRSEEHTSELQSHHDLVCRLLLEKKKTTILHQNSSQRLST